MKEELGSFGSEGDNWKERNAERCTTQTSQAFVEEAGVERDSARLKNECVAGRFA